MPTVDESAEQRETFGNAPGWANTAKADDGSFAPPAQQEASPAPDAEAAPSAADPSQEQVTEQAPPPTSQPEPEKKWNQPPEERWEELRQQRLAAEARAAKAEELAQLALQKLQNPPVQSQPDVDPYAGMDAATAEFYRNMDKRIRAEAQAIATQQMQPILEAAKFLREHQAKIDVKLFRSENPDIKPNSEEEKAVAFYVQQNFDIETAKKLAMFDTLEAENRALKTKQATIPQKRAANTETSVGIPQTAGLPPRHGDWKQRAGEIVDKGGGLYDVLGAVFGGRR